MTASYASTSRALATFIRLSISQLSDAQLAVRITAVDAESKGHLREAHDACRVAVVRKNTHDPDVASGETIGERIKRERLRLGLTQRQLADAVGVGVPHISKVEAGRENPGDPLLRSLARVFKVDPDELFIVARRVPDALVERLATDPQTAVAYLRTFPSSGGKPK